MKKKLRRLMLRALEFHHQDLHEKLDKLLETQEIKEMEMNLLKQKIDADVRIASLEDEVFVLKQRLKDKSYANS